MMGPMTYVKHLMSGPRLPFTGAYFGSIGLTLYFSLGVSNDFTNPTGIYWLLTHRLLASLYHFDTHLGPGTNGLPDLVLGFLFPDGF
jgi:hypothetical protein